MLIESEKILEAKEKLGDENAFIMAEALGLDDFDERNLKACCPYHEEDTPSFIYDKKRISYGELQQIESYRGVNMLGSTNK